jgi:hypothetical protein
MIATSHLAVATTKTATRSCPRSEGFSWKHLRHVHIPTGSVSRYSVLWGFGRGKLLEYVC